MVVKLKPGSSNALEDWRIDDFIQLGVSINVAPFT